MITENKNQTFKIIIGFCFTHWNFLDKFDLWTLPNEAAQVHYVINPRGPTDWNVMIVGASQALKISSSYIDIHEKKKKSSIAFIYLVKIFHSVHSCLMRWSETSPAFFFSHHFSRILEWKKKGRGTHWKSTIHLKKKTQNQIQCNSSMRKLSK